MYPAPCSDASIEKYGQFTSGVLWAPCANCGKSAMQSAQRRNVSEFSEEVQMTIKTLIRDGFKHLLPAPLYWRFLAWLVGDFDAEVRLLPYLCDKTRVAIDVGASKGNYTVHLLNHSRKCYAFEARPKAVAHLVQRLTARPHPRLCVETVALSDSTGYAQLRILKDDEGRSSIETANPLERFGVVEVLEVPTKRLDDCAIIEPVGFIKIDVEGHEEAVLHGAKGTLLRDRPSLIIEIEERHKPHCITAVNAFLEELGYKGFYFHDGRLMPIQSFKANQYQDTSKISYSPNRGQDYINNFVFVSSRSMVRVQHLLL